jgi:hypothetical protein
MNPQSSPTGCYQLLVIKLSGNTAKSELTTQDTPALLSSFTIHYSLFNILNSSAAPCSPFKRSAAVLTQASLLAHAHWHDHIPDKPEPDHAPDLDK